MKAWLARLQPTGVAIALALVALAAAVFFHGAAQRYDFANLNVRQVTRRDRLTGSLELCTRDGGSFVCSAAMPLLKKDPFAAVGDSTTTRP